MKRLYRSKFHVHFCFVLQPKLRLRFSGNLSVVVEAKAQSGSTEKVSSFGEFWRFRACSRGLVHGLDGLVSEITLCLCFIFHIYCMNSLYKSLLCELSIFCTCFVFVYKPFFHCVSFPSAPAKYFANNVIFIDNLLICRRRNFSCRSGS